MADEAESDPESVHIRGKRRQFLRSVAAVGALPLVTVGAAQEAETDIILDGDTPGWEGVEPEEIEGEVNPTLNLVEGETYVLEWENVDGEPHNFVIEDPEGENIVETEVISERGATQTVEFEATREMAEYYCAVHPVSMRGEIDLGEEPEDEVDDEERERFFPEGPSVGIQTVADGMTAPTDFAVPPGEDDRMYVADQTGELWVADEDDRREEPFLDVADRMVAISEEFAGSYADPEGDYDERGLLGVEFHPEYEDNGLFYVNYSAPPNEQTPDGWSHVQVISEFEVPGVADDGEEGNGQDGDDEETENAGDEPDDDLPQAANPDSERRIITFQSPQYNHNSGPMAFGPDGDLYVPMGDGGGANDEMYGHVDDWYDENAGGNGQDTEQNLLGGIHRLDVDAEPTEHYRTDEDAPDEPEGEEGYAIPDDNPLVDEEGHLDEYYSWGWRNPYGISFDQDDRLMVADAGQALFETAYEVEMGGNYSWNVKEGTQCFSTEAPGDPPEECPDRTPDDVRGGEELLDPVVEYPQNFQGRKLGIVIIGGHVYEGTALGELEGSYIFGDWTQDVARGMPRGRVFAATVPDYGQADDEDGTGDEQEDPDDENGPDEDETAVPLDELWEMEELVFAGSDDGELHQFVRQFGRDREGEVYVLVNQIGVPEGNTGAVLQLVPPGEGEEIETPETDEDPDDDEELDDDDEDEEPDDDDDGEPDDEPDEDDEEPDDGEEDEEPDEGTENDDANGDEEDQEEPEEDE